MSRQRLSPHYYKDTFDFAAPLGAELCFAKCWSKGGEMFQAHLLSRVCSYLQVVAVLFPGNPSNTAGLFGTISLTRPSKVLLARPAEY